MTEKVSETDLIKMFKFVIDNIFAMFDGRASQQKVGIPLGSNCIPLLPFIRMVRTLYSGFTNTNEKKLAWFFNFTFSYKDDVLSRKNFKLVSMQ